MAKAFGVGCFQFRYADESRMADFSPKQFKADLVSALEKIENLSNLQVLREDNSVGFRSFVEDADGEMYPCVVGFSIEFDLYIPTKVQAKIVDDFPIENLHVHIQYGYEKSVAFVWFDSQSENCEPSEAVIVAREYIAERLGEDFQFSVLGPSPFHANFYIKESPTEPFCVLDSTDDRAGYGRFEVWGPPLSQPWMFSEIASRMVEPLSRFYFLTSLTRRLESARSNIFATSQLLLENDSGTAIQRSRKFFSDREDVNFLQKSVIEEKILRTEITSFFDEHDSREGITAELPLKHYFDQFRKIARYKEWSEFAEVAKFFEERRLRLVGNLSTLAAAIFGGLVGGVLGANLSSPGPTQASLPTTAAGRSEQATQNAATSNEAAATSPQSASQGKANEKARSFSR